MTVVISGSGGINTPGLESTAMPTVGGDAVVESGSNSDGEWTRWGDGTMQVRRRFSSVPIPSGSVATIDWDYPASFSDTSALTISGIHNTPDPTSYPYALTATNVGLSSCDLHTFRNSGDFWSYVTINGRWK